MEHLGDQLDGPAVSDQPVTEVAAAFVAERLVSASSSDIEPVPLEVTGDGVAVALVVTHAATASVGSHRNAFAGLTGARVHDHAFVRLRRGASLLKP